MSIQDLLTEHFLSGSEVHQCFSLVNLGARAGAGTPGRVTRGASAAAWRVAARTALASASASTAATRARATVAGAARAVRLHTNVGRLSLDTNMHTRD